MGKPKMNKRAFTVNRRAGRRDYRNNSGCLVLIVGALGAVSAAALAAGEALSRWS